MRESVEAAHAGKFLVLDILSGRYAIAQDDATATVRLLEEVPAAVTYGVRVGKREAYDG